MVKLRVWGGELEDVTVEKVRDDVDNCRPELADESTLSLLAEARPNAAVTISMAREMTRAF